MRLPGASREGGIEPRRQRPAKIDGCPRQNSAYRPGRIYMKIPALHGGDFSVVSDFFNFYISNSESGKLVPGEDGVPYEEIVDGFT